MCVCVVNTKSKARLHEMGTPNTALGWHVSVGVGMGDNIPAVGMMCFMSNEYHIRAILVMKKMACAIMKGTFSTIGSMW